MSLSAAFALKNSGLNPFLFAEVGTELNGSTLTILSVIARLGEDPWAEAAKWAKLPKAAMIERLAESIRRMPLPPEALLQARTTAARLVLLLPSQVQSPLAVPDSPVDLTQSIPKWLPLVLAALLALGVAYTGMRGVPAAQTQAAPVTAPVAEPQAPVN
jgi:hypothetical protein